MATSTQEEYLRKSRAAAALARENLRAANVIKPEKLFAQGFGLLLYAAEETAKAAIYLYASADLITFENRSDPTRLYFNENWLINHKEKYSEFARIVSMELLLATLPNAVRETDDESTAALRLTAILVTAAYFQAWGDRFEELREMAFLSGPPVSGKTDVGRPGRMEFEAFEPIVRAEIERLEERLSGQPDREKLAGDLPSRELWQKFVVSRPRKEDRWVAFQKFLDEVSD
jgi:hypothetical protein